MVPNTSVRPPQTQPAPGTEKAMDPRPRSEASSYVGAGKLRGKVALVTGGDSGIGKATAISFAKEGADVAIVYLSEHEDAQATKKLIEETGQRCLLLAGDLRESQFCTKVVDTVMTELGQLNIVVNNAAEQHPQDDIAAISDEQLLETFQTNVFAYFYIARAAMPHLKAGDVIINTASVTAYRGSQHLLDYSATKGAVVAFTRSLSQALADKKIRVNGVAPGPVWTPLIPSTFSAEKVEKFGSQVPMGRAGQPDEIAPCFVFLASSDSSYMTGQMLHPNGGEIVNT